MNSENEKIIFLDIDGVLQPKKSHLTISNLEIYNKIMSSLSENASGREIHQLEKEYALQASFEKYAIELINRLVKKSTAKLVLITNWRKSIGVETTKKKLIDEGIKEEYFHKDYYCHYKMSSGKAHEIYFWLDRNRKTKVPKRPDLKIMSECTEQEWLEHQREESEWHKKVSNYGIDYIVIDDDTYEFNSSDFSDKLVSPNFDEGFNVHHYRIALGMLKGIDKEYHVYPIENDFFKIAEKYIHDKSKIYDYFYSISKNRKYPLCYLISEDNAKALISDKSYMFIGVPKETRTVEEIKTSWLERVESELYSKYGKKHKLIYNDIFSVREGATFKGEPINFECPIEDSPKKTPFIITGLTDDKKPIYFYAPDDVENDYDFLYGYLKAVENKSIINNT